MFLTHNFSLYANKKYGGTVFVWPKRHQVNGNKTVTFLTNHLIRYIITAEFVQLIH